MPGEVVVQDQRGPRRVVVTFPLPPSAWTHLGVALGDGVEIVDIRAADGQEDTVLVLSTSRQLIAKIRAAFPSATVVVVEVEDRDHGVELGGQVIRSLDAGADGYYVARSMDHLAGVVERAFALRGAGQETAALEPPPGDELDSILDRLVHREHLAERAPAPAPAPAPTRGRER